MSFYLTPIKSNAKNDNKSHTQDKPTDWICMVCNNLNFSFRKKCNRCKTQTRTQNQNQLASAYSDYYYNNQNYLSVPKRALADLTNCQTPDQKFDKTSYSHTDIHKSNCQLRDSIQPFILSYQSENKQQSFDYLAKEGNCNYNYNNCIGHSQLFENQHNINNYSCQLFKDDKLTSTEWQKIHNQLSQQKQIKDENNNSHYFEYPNLNQKSLNQQFTPEIINQTKITPLKQNNYNQILQASNNYKNKNKNYSHNHSKIIKDNKIYESGSDIDAQIQKCISRILLQ